MAAQKRKGVNLTKEQFDALPVMRVGIPDSGKVMQWKTLQIYHKCAQQVGYRWWLGSYEVDGEKRKVVYTLIINNHNKGRCLSVFNETVANESEYYEHLANTYLGSGLINTCTLAQFLRQVVRQTPFVTFTADDLTTIN